jgi:hypothetical protein
MTILRIARFLFQVNFTRALDHALGEQRVFVKG